MTNEDHEYLACQSGTTVTHYCARCDIIHMKPGATLTEWLAAGRGTNEN